MPEIGSPYAESVGAAGAALAPASPVDSARLARLASRITVSGPSDRISVRSPFTGATLGSVPSCVPADVELAVARARAAQPHWAARSFAERAEVLLRFHDLVLKRQNEALDLIQVETGKARRHAFEEILDTVVVSRYYARRGASFLRPRRRRGALPLLTRTYERRAPMGVVGFIVPWNYPLNLAVTDVAAALMAGNAGVIKPDPQTSFTALWALELLREAGLPEGVLQVVTGDGPVTGGAIIDQVDYLMFTGSTRTGRIVAARAAARLIGCSLELGGKNPMIVCADASLENAVDGAIRGCFVGAGQVCVSIERIYVHESLYSRFLDRFAERARAIKIGSAFDFSIEMGSMTSEAQLAIVEDHVRDAVQKGATVVTGGRRRPDIGPLFYEPTILTGVREGMKVWAEETFGPVVSVYPFTDEAEAIERANATNYGLNASVWTRNTRRGAALASAIQAGAVNVNEAYAAAWGSVDAPLGGMRDSGMRARHGAEGILKYTHSQVVAVQRMLPIAPPPGMDPEAHARMMSRLLKVLRWIRILG